MEKRPNPYKIPAKAAARPPAEEVPVNGPENLLFGFLGAVSAVVIGLIFYQAEIQSQLMTNRNLAQGRYPASLTEPAHPAFSKEEEFDAYAFIPYLY